MLYSATYKGAHVAYAPKSPPHQPNITFGGDAKQPEAQQAKAPESQEAKVPSKKADASQSNVMTALKWMTLGLMGTGAVGGYANLNNRINATNIQNVALQDQVQQMTTALQSKVTLTDLAKVVSEVAPANVMVKGRGGLGSGTWLQDKNGNLFVLTNHHVVDDNSIRGWDSPPTFEIRLHNGSDINTPQVVEGQLIKLPDGKYAESADHDLALIGISTPNFRLPSHIKPLQFRDLKANPLRAGEFVVVVGTPYGHTDNVSHGIISHVERKFDDFEQANVFIGVDAPINPGNSGGSCYDMQGRYLGPPTAGYRGADGLGFVIRTDVVQDILKGWGVEMPQ
jgi:S1-C subfamily serine protease